MYYFATTADIQTRDWSQFIWCIIIPYLHAASEKVGMISNISACGLTPEPLPGERIPALVMPDDAECMMDTVPLELETEHKVVWVTFLELPVP
jgi:hypothetical protein